MKYILDDVLAEFVDALKKQVPKSEKSEKSEGNEESSGRKKQAEPRQRTTQGKEEEEEEEGRRRLEMAQHVLNLFWTHKDECCDCREGKSYETMAGLQEHFKYG